jgi:hypothetical protein
MKDDASRELDIKVALMYCPLGCLTNSSIGFGQKLVQETAAFQSSFEFVGLGTKLVVRELLEFGLELVYPVYYWL